ncbi:LptE family protein [Mucilaginibacter sp. KACC 22063]|uniref:LptE family protein n=1 Tax=Mucilaginibacter sp. KACC 22063 TaxID=3025666 RepID=UPI002366B149|nr:LptE family protein [Mucilaginibacter sp. KACC 22063]WDF55948.1 LptE family protein [Mucilaginibacter sp. KACC 22063]
MLKRKLFIYAAVAMLVCITQSCSYRLDTNSIPLSLKTINIGFFENNAPMVVANLSQQFTESLKDRVRSQTRLSIVRGEADAMMTGNIIGYSIAPVSVQAPTTNSAPPIASASRLTITVSVKFSTNTSNKEDKKIDFDQQFSEYTDFNGDIGNKEQALIAIINRKLIDDIFNRAFNNW